ncbi:uncharacterized protein [Gossypium hirsutum]|uniref:Uncharacterized protein n=1 Tax=Gossypium hirsutum TaxID=3635 RepID=A0A1U8IYT6_GOSHI|nr:uncharacterized protein LOC107899872 [Gossypium hirsutum]
MKDILSKKRRFGEFEAIALTQGYTVMLMKKLPPKLKDPRSFTILCSIGNHYVGKTLSDLEASINLMSIFIFKKLGIWKAIPITVTLQLADQSYAHPEEFKADQNMPIILGRPFLATDENEECHAIGLIETTVEEEFNRICHNKTDNNKDSLERIDKVCFEELGEFIEAKQTLERPGKNFDSLDLSSHSFKSPKPSIEERPTLELKPLLQHLKYEYLGDNSPLPI